MGHVSYSPTMRLLAACVAFSILALPLPAQRWTGDPVRDSARFEAANLLQGHADGEFIPEERLQTVMRALAAIRRQLPELRDIRGDTWRPSLVIYPPKGQGSLFIQASGARNPYPPAALWAAPVSRLGLPEVDSLNAALGVDTLYVWKLPWAVLHFSDPPNLPRLEERYRALSAIEDARVGPVLEPIPGNAHWIELVEYAPVLRFVFTRGSGDCPSGCIHRAFYYVSYDSRTGRATRVPCSVGDRWTLPSGAQRTERARNACGG